MRVKLLTSRAGIDADGNAYSENYGDEVEVSAEEAERLIADGAALPLGDTPMPASARAGAEPETAGAGAGGRGKKA